MGRIKDIDVELHELPDFEKGVRFENERIIKLIKKNKHTLVDLWEVIKLIEISGESKEAFVIPSRKNTNE